MPLPSERIPPIRDQICIHPTMTRRIWNSHSRQQQQQQQKATWVYLFEDTMSAIKVNFITHSLDIIVLNDDKVTHH